MKKEWTHAPTPRINPYLLRLAMPPGEKRALLLDTAEMIQQKRRLVKTFFSKRSGFYSIYAHSLSKEIHASSPTPKTFLFTGQLSLILTIVSPTRRW